MFVLVRRMVSVEGVKTFTGVLVAETREELQAAATDRYQTMMGGWFDADGADYFIKTMDEFRALVVPAKEVPVPVEVPRKEHETIRTDALAFKVMEKYGEASDALDSRTKEGVARSRVLEVEAYRMQCAWDLVTGLSWDQMGMEAAARFAESDEALCDVCGDLGAERVQGVSGFNHWECVS